MRIGKAFIAFLLSVAIALGGLPVPALAEIASTARDGAVGAQSMEGVGGGAMSSEAPEQPADADDEWVAAKTREIVDALRTRLGGEPKPQEVVRGTYDALVDLCLEEGEAQPGDSLLSEVPAPKKPTHAQVTRVFARVMDEFKVTSAMVRSVAGETTWNMVSIGEAWYHVDAWAAAEATNARRSQTKSANGVKASDDQGVGDVTSGTEMKNGDADSTKAAWLCIGDEHVRLLDQNRSPWTLVDGKEAPMAEHDLTWKDDGNAQEKAERKDDALATNDPVAPAPTAPTDPAAPTEPTAPTTPTDPAAPTEPPAPTDSAAPADVPTPSESASNPGTSETNDPYLTDPVRASKEANARGAERHTQQNPGDESSELRPESDSANELENGSPEELKTLLTVSSVDPRAYTYQATPMLSPFNYLIYVKTSNPDPTSFRLVDKKSRYLSGTETAEFSQLDKTFLDVRYENASTRRVRGGYIFSDSETNSDGGELTLQAKTTGGSFVDTNIRVTMPALKDYVDYIVEDCTNRGGSFFERLDAVGSYLDQYSVYPFSVCDTNKPNAERPYPFFAVSPYPELDLNEHYEMYESSDRSTLLYWLYPFVLDSLGYPGTIAAAAKRLNASCECVEGDTHASVDVTFNGTTHYYYGAGNGGYDPLFSNAVGVSYLFDGSATDKLNESLASAHQRLMAQKQQATANMQSYRNQLRGEPFVRSIGTGSWIRVASEGGFSYGQSFSFIVGMPEGQDTWIASDAWVDGRYVNKHEQLVLGEKFSDHPTADIVERNVTYRDINGVEHTCDVLYRYDHDTKDWRAYCHYQNNNMYSWSSYGNLPDNMILTADEVRAMRVDRNTAKPIAGALIYDGTKAPGTPTNIVHLKSISMDKTVIMAKGSSRYLNVNYTPSNADFKDNQAISSNPRVATVSYNGDIQALEVGTTYITVRTYDGNCEARCKVTVVEKMPSFSDVNYYDWFCDVVTRAAAYGFFSGYQNGKFGPYDSITRGQVAVILWNMTGGPAAGAGAKNFPDVKSDKYYYKAVRWASSAGVVSGYGNGKFGPNDKVTREQLATMIANYVRSVKGRSVTGSKSDFNSMRDKDKVSNWAIPSVGWCFRNNILSGSGGNVNPHGNAARAEAAKMVVGLHDLLS